MINSIKLPFLRNGEYVQFIADVLEIVKHNGPQELNVQKQYNKLLVISQEIEELFKIPTGSIISPELQELDDRRDDAINGITALINGYSYNTDPVIKSYAKLLENHLSVFGVGIATDNYISETATIRNIISDWDKQPELTAAINALGLNAWRMEMEQANNLFNERYVLRAEKKGAASNDSLSSRRVETNDAYYALRDFLDANFILNEGADPFGKAVSSLNALIDDYNILLSRRVNKEPEQVATAVA